jgi:hypothetical protein
MDNSNGILYENLEVPNYFLYDVIYSNLWHKVVEVEIKELGETVKLDLFYLLTLHKISGLESLPSATTYMFKLSLCMLARQKEYAPYIM